MRDLKAPSEPETSPGVGLFTCARRAWPLWGLLFFSLVITACASREVPLRDSEIAADYLVSLTPTPTESMPTPTPTNTPIPTSTPLPQPTPIPTATPTSVPVTPTPVVHIVQQGETLAAIAEQYNVSVEAIEAANDNLEPTRLQIGQEILIPVGGVDNTLALSSQPTETPSPPPATATAPPATGGGGLAESTPMVITVPQVGEDATIHYVKEGETPSQIAEQYGITVGDLLAANGLPPDVQLIAGTPLIIPKGTVTPAPTRTPTAGPAGTATPTPISLTGLSFLFAASATPGATTPTPVPPTPTPVVYTVQRGDTPQRIADKFGISVDALLAANPGINPRALQIGQTLTIPPRQGANGEPLPTPTPTPIIVFAQHTVQQGETLASIAEAYGITLGELVKYNEGRLTPEGGVEPGMVLQVPLGTPTPTPTPTPFPTFTPTPAPMYVAPVPVLPRPGEFIEGDTLPLLVWTSPGVLQDDEYYAIRVRFIQNGQVVHVAHFRTKATSLRLPPELQPPQLMVVRWDVLVIRMLTEEKVGQALSPRSRTEQFYWGP